MVMDPVILRDLRQDYQSGRLIIFVGAGVSVGGGLPSWKDLAVRLRERVAASGKGGAVLKEIDDYIQSSQLLDAVSAAKHALDFEFEHEVRQALDDKKRPVPPVAKAIAGLQDHLWAVLTTNLDRFLERAFEGSWPDLTSPPSNLARENHYILKMHGTLRDASTWVFTRNQYDEIMFASPLLQDTFLALYMTHPILFVGFGLNDENIEKTLGKVRALSKGQPPTHYALLPEWEVGPSRQTKLSAAGVRLLKYSAHDEVPEVLRSLAGDAAPVVTDPPPPAAEPFDSPISALLRPPPSPARAPRQDLAIPTVAFEPAERPIAAGVQPGAVKVFISYAGEDHELLERLINQLSPLVTRGLLSIWHPGMIGAGEDIDTTIRARLNEARLIIMLLSADYLATTRLEAQRVRILERHRSRAAEAIAILLRPCMYDWDGDRQSFMGVGVFPRKDEGDPIPVVSWPDRDQAFLSLADAIRQKVLKLRSPG